MSTKPNVSYVVKKDEAIERALRRFKRLCEHAGITKIVRGKKYFEKPSDVRRREARKQVRNRHRAERKSRERVLRKLDRARRQQRSEVQGGNGSKGLDLPGDVFALEHELVESTID